MTPNVVVSGSLAFDRIYDYPGRFKDSINPKKLHQLNVSFMVRTVKESFGGTAGNIGYSLALLGVKPTVIGSVGNDFIRYRRWLTAHGVSCAHIMTHHDAVTASAHIITDKDNNQISVFHPGALAKAIDTKRPTLRRAIASARYAIIAPDNTVTMARMAAQCRAQNVAYLFDPGQQLTALTRTQLRAILTHADGVITNDYEMSLLTKNSGISLRSLCTMLRYVVTTLGAKGSVIYNGNDVTRIPAVRPRAVVDPTGAGDAYRAGFVTGLLATGSFLVAGRMGSLSSAYTVEMKGTQTHAFTRKQFATRYRSAFSKSLPVI